MLQQEILRLVQLVESLQQLARADAARAFLKKKPLRLSDLLSRLLSLHQLNIQGKELLVETDFCADEPEIHGDEDKLLQAFQRPDGKRDQIYASVGANPDCHCTGPGRNAGRV